MPAAGTTRRQPQHGTHPSNPPTHSAPRAQLIFDDDNIQLRVNTIYVAGRLRIGGEGCRLQSPIGITFSRVQ